MSYKKWDIPTGFHFGAFPHTSDQFLELLPRGLIPFLTHFAFKGIASSFLLLEGDNNEIIRDVDIIGTFEDS